MERPLCEGVACHERTTARGQAAAATAADLEAGTRSGHRRPRHGRTETSTMGDGMARRPQPRSCRAHLGAGPPVGPPSPPPPPTGVGKSGSVSGSWDLPSGATRCLDGATPALGSFFWTFDIGISFVRRVDQPISQHHCCVRVIRFGPLFRSLVVIVERGSARRRRALAPRSGQVL